MTCSISLTVVTRRHIVIVVTTVCEQIASDNETFTFCATENGELATLL